MAKTKQQKTEHLEQLKEAVENKGVVFVSQKGVLGNESVSLRKDLKSEDVTYLVVKKTLLQKAFEGSKAKGEAPLLEGEVAIAFSQDSLLPAQLIGKHKKALGEEKLEIVGGIFEGDYKDADSMRVISQIPSKEVLYSQFLALNLTPISQFVVVLNEYAKTKE